MSGNDSQPSVELLKQYTIGFEANALGCILWGIYITISGANLTLLRKRRYRILLLFTLFQLVISTLYLVISLYSEPGDLLAIFGLFSPNGPDQLSSWHALVSDGAFLVNTLASDAFLLYRCYVVWMGKKPIIVLPVLIYLATFGASVAWLVVDSVPGAVYSTQDVQIAGTTAFSCSVAMNVTASVLISVRLLMHRRAISRAVGAQHSRFYLSYLAMTLESAVLYTVFVIITLVMFTINSPFLSILFPVLGNVQVIAPSLIIYRIGSGISFETGGYGNSTMSTLCFGSKTLRTRDSAHQVSKAVQLLSEVRTGSDTKGSNSSAHARGGASLDLEVSAG